MSPVHALCSGLPGYLSGGWTIGLSSDDDVPGTGYGLSHIPGDLCQEYVARYSTVGASVLWRASHHCLPWVCGA